MVETDRQTNALPTSRIKELLTPTQLLASGFKSTEKQLIGKGKLQQNRKKNENQIRKIEKIKQCHNAKKRVIIFLPFHLLVVIHLANSLRKREVEQCMVHVVGIIDCVVLTVCGYSNNDPAD